MRGYIYLPLRRWRPLLLSVRESRGDALKGAKAYGGFTRLASTDRTNSQKATETDDTLSPISSEAKHEDNLAKFKFLSQLSCPAGTC